MVGTSNQSVPEIPIDHMLIVIIINIVLYDII